MPSLQRLLTAVVAALAVGPAGAWTPEQLWDTWRSDRFVAVPAHCISSDLLGREIERLAARHGDRLGVNVVGRSYEGAPIRLLRIGRGRHNVLLWSQMHGDEPSATPALLDLADFLLTAAGRDDPDPAAARILDELTLLLVPMLNPDGADTRRRRNAQEIDINRDARALATPEGRLLAALREEHEPILGFNLHDQGRRISVGDTGVVATSSVLAVAGDAAGTITPGRERTRRAAAAVATALEPLFPGGTSRYDETFNPRAFGDNLTAWGTPVLLIESGGLPPGRPAADLTGMNFVAILRVLEDLVLDDLAGHDPAVYEALGRNRRGGYVDVVLQGGSIVPPDGPPYRADLAFDRDFDRRWGECSSHPVRRLRHPEPAGGSRVAEIGDVRGVAAGETLDAAGRWIVEPFTVWLAGWPLPEWVDAESLAALARLGVGELRWQVPAERFIEARKAVRSHHCPPCARLTVEVDEASSVGAVLAAEPRVPRSRSLDDVLTALLGDLRPTLDLSPRRRRRAARSEHPLAALRPLWGGGPGAFWPAQKPLARGGPASFLVIAPGGQASHRLDLSNAELTAVWLDGELLGNGAAAEGSAPAEEAVP